MSKDNLKNKKPYKIIQTPNAGRTLVATRDIKAQELILTDEAPIVAPILYSGQVNFKISFFCIVCFKLCRGSLKCPRCKLPICDKNCAKLKTHIEDCPVLRDVFDDEDDPKGIESVEERFQHLVLAATCLAPLRFIRLQRAKHPVGTLSSSRNSETKLVNWEQDVVEMLSGCFINGKSDIIQEAEVINALGVWATNGVKVQRSSAFLPSVVLFPDFCMANHQCNPKAMYVPYFSERSFKIDARAQTDIKAGQEITVRYTDALSANWERRKATQEKWNFTCNCNRCKDITEFNTFTSGIVCCQCDKGTLLIDVLDQNWNCTHCKYTTTHSEAWLTLLDPLERSRKECSQQSSDSILEQWLWTASKILHPNHVWILEIEYRLLFLYGKKLKTMKFWKKPVQLRMLQLGLHLLEILSLIDEGPTRWRGMILQELVTPWMDLAKHNKATKCITDFQFKRKVIIGMLYAENAVECLKHDPKNANQGLENFSLHS